MKPSICGLIPFYNNHATVANIAERAWKHLLDLILVDDGSYDGSAQTIQMKPGMRLIRHEYNCGKGAAVKTGIRHAIDSGFSHILQLDADGQHNPDDIPKFLSISERHPDACIIGSRDRTDNLPIASKFGRKFGNFWFKIETLGYPISDTQCGFRVYPLKLFDTAISKCNRMDFDVEILILAIRHGFDLIDLPVTVNYFSDDRRVTHFLPFLDNWLMSKLHFRMTWSVLLHWPAYLHARRKNR